jgi:hypothetical protein
VQTAFGSKTVAALAPGKSTSAAFTTRQASIPAGTVAVTVTDGGDSAQETAEYSAASCG